MPKPIAESAPLSEVTASTDANAGLLDVVFITEGKGSSGYYSREVVESAAPLFAAGTHMYFDHPSDAEAMERPGRSVRDMCAVIKEAGTFDPKIGGVRGKVKPFAPYRDLLLDEDFAKNIGLSIRGSATDIVNGVVEGLAVIDSVDFVTRAGRGGHVLAVMESARYIREATADDRAQQLTDAVRAANAGAGIYAYVIDQDAEKNVVWFRVSSESGPSTTYEQTYDVAANDASVTLTGDPIEVSRMTTYVPVTRPGSSTNPATESEEDTMPKIQIEESEHSRLTEKAGRVDVLENENATLKAKVTSLEEADRRRTREDRARAIVAEKATEAKVTFTDLEVVGLVAGAPVAEDGTLNEDAFGQVVDTQVAARKTTAEAAAPVHGFGASAAAASAAVAESGRPAKSPWGRPLTEQKGA